MRIKYHGPIGENFARVAFLPHQEDGSIPNEYAVIVHHTTGRKQAPRERRFEGRGPEKYFRKSFIFGFE